MPETGGKMNGSTRGTMVERHGDISGEKPTLPRLVLRSISIESDYSIPAHFHRQWIEIKAAIEADVTRLREWWKWSTQYALSDSIRVSAADVEDRLKGMEPFVAHVETMLNTIQEDLGKCQEEIDQYCQADEEGRSQ